MGATAPAPAAVVEIGPPESDEPPTRYLPGDWEAPDTLLVAHDSEWPEPLAAIIAAAKQDAQVFVVASPAELADPTYMTWLSSHGAEVLVADHDTPWIRDYGPMSVVDSEGMFHWLDFRYSDERPLDDFSPAEVADRLGVELERQAEWLDGGALIGSGTGLCAITDTSLGTLGIDEDDEEQLERFLGAVGCDVLAVVPSLPDEETGHVDLIAQFLSEDVVAVAQDVSAQGPVADALETAVETLEGAARAHGHPLRIVRVPLAVRGDVFYSYVNVMRLRSQLLVPQFVAVSELERDAYETFRAELPGVRITPIAADAMALRGGAIHCVTLGLHRARDIRGVQGAALSALR